MGTSGSFEGETRDESHGRRLARLRESQNVTQRDLARVMRLRGHRWTQQTVAAVETGERQLKLAEATDAVSVLGGTVEDLTDEPRKLEARVALAEYLSSLQMLESSAAAEHLWIFARCLDKLAEEGVHPFTEDQIPTQDPVAVGGTVIIDAVRRARELVESAHPQNHTIRHYAELTVASASELVDLLKNELQHGAAAHTAE